MRWIDPAQRKRSLLGPVSAESHGSIFQFIRQFCESVC